MSRTCIREDWDVAMRLALFVCILGGLVCMSALPAFAGDPPYTPPQAGEAMRFACGPDGTQSSGAKYRICMPMFGWNRDLLVYAHGYVAPNKPIAIPEDQLTLPEGTYIPDLAGFLGYAFAVTSYSVNGLAVKQGIADLVDLVALFRAGASQSAPRLLDRPIGRRTDHDAGNRTAARRLRWRPGHLRPHRRFSPADQPCRRFPCRLRLLPARRYARHCHGCAPGASR